MEINKLVELIKNNLDEMKIENIQIFDVEKKSSLAKYIIIGSGRGERHIESSLEQLRSDLKEKINPMSQIEGKFSNWLLLDLKDVIVNLFTEESRKIYNLDELWENE